MEGFSILFYLLIASTAVGLPLILIGVIVSGVARKSSVGQVLQRSGTVIGRFALVWLVFYGLVMCNREMTEYDENQVAGTYRLVSAPKFISSQTYAQYQLTLSQDKTYQFTRLPDSIGVCQQGTYEVKNLPDDYHLVDLRCEESFLQVYFNPDGDAYQLIINADRYDADQSKAIVFERVE